MNNSNHPWRRPNNRGARFIVYVQSLPSDERQRIEAAERTFLAKAEDFTSPQRRAERTYAAGMRGVQENVPWYRA